MTFGLVIAEKESAAVFLLHSLHVWKWASLGTVYMEGSCCINTFAAEIIQ